MLLGNSNAQNAAGPYRNLVIAPTLDIGRNDGH